jgi:ParB family chromosome partitioning protein
MTARKVDEIVVASNRRALRSIVDLASSISEVGLLNPITITEDNCLIAGYHRLEACKSLGMDSIDVRVVPLTGLKARLAELDENLIRNESTVLERSEGLKERKEIYEALHPETRKGNTTERAEVKRNDFVLQPSFASDTAAKINVSPRTIQQEVQIASKITPEVKEIIRDTPIAENKTELIKLSRLEPEAQVKAVEHFRARGTGEVEWYTPPEYIELARKVLGSIDLDPASSEQAQEQVAAKQYFGLEEDGLSKEWRGSVWLNPPYAQPQISQFVDKLITEYAAGHITQAIMLTHNYTDTAWFHAAEVLCSRICFTRGRIKFVSSTGAIAAPTQGQAFFYYGDKPELFESIFSEVGFVR